MTARLVAALERLLLIVCHIGGHTVDSYSGACMRCGAQIFAPLKETR